MNIIFENDKYLVINKPSGLVVNSSETTHASTLQRELSKHFNLKKGDLGIGDRAGIVHRLDKETSGVLVVAKTSEVFEYLQGEFKDRRVKKEYLALVHGLVKDDSGEIKSRIERIGKFGKFGNLGKREPGGREAETHYQVVKRYFFLDTEFERIMQRFSETLNKARINYLNKNAKAYTLVKVFPKTGRTHQIRVHLKSIGHPIVSDLIYAPSKLLKFDLAWCSRLFLHAREIEFIDLDNGKVQKFDVDLPNELKSAMLFLKS